jgi:hypothetical protein
MSQSQSWKGQPHLRGGPLAQSSRARRSQPRILAPDEWFNEPPTIAPAPKGAPPADTSLSNDPSTTSDGHQLDTTKIPNPITATTLPGVAGVRIHRPPVSDLRGIDGPSFPAQLVHSSNIYESALRMYTKPGPCEPPDPPLKPTVLGPRDAVSNLTTISSNPAATESESPIGPSTYTGTANPPRSK